MTDPVLSVVMSVYNNEKYVAAAVESILNQSFKDFEFIIVDDGSTDGTRKIIENFAKKDQRIKLVSQNNMGLAVSLNRGITLARGEWIARMDADDIAVKNRFERQLAWLKETGDDLCGCGVQVIGGIRKSNWQYPESQGEIETQLLFNSAFAHPAIVARSVIFKRYPYVENRMPAQDYELWTRLVIAGVRMSNCPDNLLEYRQHGEQISISRQEAQFEIRNRIAREYWSNRGVVLPLRTIIKFTEVDEVHELLYALRKMNLTPRDYSIAYNAIWKLAMRSGNLGMSLYHACIKARIQFGLFSNLALLFVCITKITPGNRFFELLHAAR